jgi:hypothetical protein
VEQVSRLFKTAQARCLCHQYILQYSNFDIK